jgi:hypothetical protein
MPMQPFRKRKKKFIYRIGKFYLIFFLRHITSFTYDRESIVERLPTRNVLVCCQYSKE